MTALAIWQRDTIYYILRQDRIQVKSAQAIETALRSGDYGELLETDGGYSYKLLEGSVQINVAFGGGYLTSLNAGFNMYDVPLKTIPAALDAAQFVLSPYLTPPEIKALVFLIAGELPAYVSSDEINYRRTLGSSHTIEISGSMSTGNALVKVTGSSDGEEAHR